MNSYKNEDYKEYFRKPISSGHYLEGKQVFYPYHWVLWDDGRKKRLLKDEEIGWHCGNWNFNCRSIAICFLNNFVKKREPTEKSIKSVKEIIAKYNVKKEKIFGHREINPNTICPGENFDQWKRKLLN
jgi:N-acetyl-anhydromuramyl-L-alanine amidase AmpD